MTNSAMGTQLPGRTADSVRSKLHRMGLAKERKEQRREAKFNAFTLRISRWRKVVSRFEAIEQQLRSTNTAYIVAKQNGCFAVFRHGTERLRHLCGSEPSKDDWVKEWTPAEEA